MLEELLETLNKLNETLSNSYEREKQFMKELSETLSALSIDNQMTLKNLKEISEEIGG